MDFLKRSLAPITDESWEEIDDTAKEVLTSQLSGRKFVDVSAPQGWDLAAIPEGRLDIKEDDSKKVRYGIRKASPVIETRTSFKLNIWELDNYNRGALDLDLEPLEDAAKKAAKFEEDVIFRGLEEANVKGLNQVSETTMDLPEDPAGVVEAVSMGITEFQDNSIEGPYSLIVSRRLWQDVARFSKGYPLKRQIEDLLGDSVVYSPEVDGALLVSTRGGDFELILGQDFSIGYEDHSSTEVKLFIAESFSFRVLEPAAVITLNG
ncbi:MAG: family 1 encapsulin nanocompartment shell protein [Candidatus Bipolaricaulota bacterium]|nr:bacteriocin family protein [Candidatus Bipolaricaulota bacterium]